MSSGWPSARFFALSVHSFRVGPSHRFSPSPLGLLSGSPCWFLPLQAGLVGWSAAEVFCFYLCVGSLRLSLYLFLLRAFSFPTTFLWLAKLVLGRKGEVLRLGKLRRRAGMKGGRGQSVGVRLRRVWRVVLFNVTEWLLSPFLVSGSGWSFLATVSGSWLWIEFSGYRFWIEFSGSWFRLEFPGYRFWFVVSRYSFLV